MTNLPPGEYVTTTTTSPPRSAPTDTGVAFIPVLSSRAPAAPVALSSMADWQTYLDARQSYSVAYDWADSYFHEGGNRLYAVAAVGPAAAKATVNIAGSSSGTALTLSAVDSGDWANGASGGLSYSIVVGGSGGSFRVIVLYRNAVEIGRTTEASTIQGLVDAVNAISATTGVSATIGGGSGQPATIGATNLAGGSIDRGSITDTQWQQAVDKFTKDLGPGQIAAPDWVTDNAHDYLASHAAARNRVAVLDPVDTTSKSTLLAAASHLAGGVNASYCILVAPWVNVPGLSSGSSGRAVPGSALYCAKAAVTDSTDGPNQAPAGVFGVARYATSPRALFSGDTINGVNDQGDLNAAGVNLIVSDQGDVLVNGNRTQVSPTGAEQDWLQASNVRYRMGLVARARQIGRNYRHRRITAAVIAEYRKDFVGVLLGDYLNGDLFGDLNDDRPETAFAVDTDSVNTAVTIQAGQLNVQLTVRPTRGAETVKINITAVGLTEPVA